jgi:hypothetical protein
MMTLWNYQIKSGFDSAQKNSVGGYGQYKHAGDVKSSIA